MFLHHRASALRAGAAERKVRYIRSRLGDTAGIESDAASVTNSSNIVFDHCSLSWSVDSVFDLIKFTGLATVQWCIRTGRIIDSQNDVGGWPALASTTPPSDSDGDGMPDAWETSHGLDPQNPADRNGDPNRDGYTNLEDYLNSLAKP